MTNKDFFVEQWQVEMKGTLNALKALPQDLDQLEYKPNQKSRSAIQIVEHILPHVAELREAIFTGELIENDKIFSSLEEAADYYTRESALLIEALKDVDEETWFNQEVSLMREGRKVYGGTMRFWFWRFLFDTIHHRGQLSTYYRAMGVRNPSIYGPAAEDREEMLAARQRAEQS